VNRLYEFLISFRYLRAKKNQAFISFNTVLSIGIVFIGVFALIVVISVMNGFQAQIRDKILDISPHIEITSMYKAKKSKGLKRYREVVKEVEGIEGITDVYPYVQGQALMRYRGAIRPVMVEGVGSIEKMPQHITRFIRSGKEKFARERGVFLGEEMTLINGVDAGDYIDIIVPKGSIKTRVGVMPGLGRFKVLGFFKTGYYPYDTGMVVMTFPQAQKLFSLGDRAIGIAVKLKDIFAMDRTAATIQRGIGFDYATETAEDKNRNLFQALRLEKMIMTVILFLVIASSTITIMGTLVMVVMEKRKAVGILKAMGAKPLSIMVIFITEGFLIGVIGAFTGAMAGIAASLNLQAIILSIEKVVNLVMKYIFLLFNLGIPSPVSLVPDRVYYFDTIPAIVNPQFVTFVAVVAVFLSTMAALFPAWQASRMSPVDTIRYE
jgi:lipoprotein-releasing system permease protein